MVGRQESTDIQFAQSFNLLEISLQGPHRYDLNLSSPIRPVLQRQLV
jgi:hypothetical protein